jgi:hypothetical protein
VMKGFFIGGCGQQYYSQAFVPATRYKLRCVSLLIPIRQPLGNRNAIDR